MNSALDTAGPMELVALSRRPSEISRFLQVSYGIYRHDPLWVAPLLLDIKKTFSDRNPFFAHAEMALWVVSRNGQDVGRIAGIIDRLHNTHQKDNAAFFGFFECVDEPEVSQRLFQAVFDWARQRGLQRVLGPMNPSANDECGLLVEGFDSSPVLMMTYNPPYYERLVAAAGFHPAKDLLAFHIDVANSPAGRLKSLLVKFRQREPNVTVRALRRQTLDLDLASIKEIYNEAWRENWGFVPMTAGEVDFMAQRLRPLLTEGLTWVAHVAAEPVGFLLALPDFNEAIQPLRGRLLTPQLFKFLPYLLGRKRPAMVRVIALGVKQGFRGRGIEAVMLGEALQVCIRLGLRAAEASWVLEDNLKSRRVIELFAGRRYKTYRLYDRPL